MSEATLILDQVQKGDPQATEELLPLVYEELRRLAAARMAQEKPGQTLQATALVHEAWLRLTGNPDYKWNGARHFFRAAGEAMRRILVENARRKQSAKHGGHLARVDVEESQIACPLPDDQVLALDEALKRLAAENPRAAEVVKLRYFVGLTEAQVALQLDVSVTTVERTWSFARVWLFHEVRRDLGTASKPA
jgi:RNA polymerase sigma factor (TIGR02999 family)